MYSKTSVVQQPQFVSWYMAHIIYMSIRFGVPERVQYTIESTLYSL